MHFDLIDAVLERRENGITTLKQVSLAEEYLQDHFATFPVLPGVLMLESMVQAGRRFLEERDRARGAAARRYVLGAVRALKYGTFVKPGHAIRVSVSVHKDDEAAGVTEFKGQAELVLPTGVLSLDAAGSPQVAVAGRFVLRPLRLEHC